MHHKIEFPQRQQCGLGVNHLAAEEWLDGKLQIYSAVRILLSKLMYQDNYYSILFEKFHRYVQCMSHAPFIL
jgi:hypothetical protein